MIVPRHFQAPASVAATLLTSGNAVASCPRSLHSFPAFTVGSATAWLAERAGFKHVVSADGDAVALARLVATTLTPPDGPLFVPAGQGQSIELAVSMRRLGFRVIRRVAYQAVGVEILPDAATSGLQDGNLMAALFYSAQTSRHFVRLVTAAGLDKFVGNVEAVSISERAAMALRSLPWRRIRVAKMPNQDAMLVLLR